MNTFDFSNEDIGLIEFCIGQFKSAYESAATVYKNDMNDDLILSTSRKLIMQNLSFSTDEYRVIYTALMYVYSICTGSLTASDDVISKCSKYLGDISALLASLPRP